MTRDLLPVASRRATAVVAWRLLRRHRGLLVAAVACFATTGLLELVGPWVLGALVDDVRSGAGDEAVVTAALFIAGAAVGGAVTSALSVAFLARAAEPALAGLREEVLDRSLHLDAARVERAGTGDLLSRVGDDVRAVGDALVEVVPLMVGSLVTIAFTAAGLFVLDWRLGLAGLLTLPAYVWSLRWYLPRSAPRYREERIAQGERAEVLVGAIQGAATVRAFGLEPLHLARIEDRSRRVLGISLDVFGLLTRFFTRMNATELLGLAAVLGTGFLLVRADAASVGAVTAAALYFHRLFNPVGALLMLFDRVQSAGASLARLAGVATLAGPPSAGASLPTRPGDLVLTGVSHEYVAGRPVLGGVGLRLPPGRTVALVGATGAGKTTLGAVAAGVLEPSAGTVSLGGVDYRTLAPATLRSRVVLVSQDVHVFSATVRESVALVREHASDEDVWEALRLARAEDWVRSLPDGLATVVGDGGHRLTPAQAQHLALARVALADPWVVVLDEATAEAGSAGARALEEAALALTRDRTALVVAHRLTQARVADEVLVLDEGRVVERGTHDELVRAGGRYAALWAAWSGDEPLRVGAAPR